MKANNLSPYRKQRDIWIDLDCFPWVPGAPGALGAPAIKIPPPSSLEVPMKVTPIRLDNVNTVNLNSDMTHKV